VNAGWLQDWTGGTQLSGVDFHRNMLPALDLAGRYATDVFTDEAVRIIQKHDTTSPLFLYLAHLACHAGNMGKLLEAPKDAIDKFGHIIEPNRKTYAGKKENYPLGTREYSLVFMNVRLLKNWWHRSFLYFNSGSSYLDCDSSKFSVFLLGKYVAIRFKTLACYAL